MSTAPQLCRVGPDREQWVQLLPPGVAEARDGRRFVLAEPEAVVAAFEADRVDLPVDYHHQHDQRTPGQTGPIPAAGWIKAMRHDATGLYGRVEWTAEAAELIRKRAFRYLSPVILAAPDGTVTRIKGASLVHNPALHLTALASQEADMDSPAPNDPAATLASLAKLLKLTPDASAEDVMDAVRALIDGEPDPTKYVPIEAMRDALRDRNGGKAELAAERVRGKVAKAVAEGYLTPAMRDWATQLCAQDEAGFDAFLASTTPAYAHLLSRSHTSAAHPSRAPASDPVGDKIAAQLGLDPARLRD